MDVLLITLVLVSATFIMLNLVSIKAVSAELLSDEPTVQVCLECDGTEEVKNVSAGDESWSVCHSCRSVEGRTEHITESEYEKRQN